MQLGIESPAGLPDRKKTPARGPVYSLQTLRDRIVTMDMIKWRVVRALAQRDRQFFDAPKRLLVL